MILASAVVTGLVVLVLGTILSHDLPDIVGVTSVLLFLDCLGFLSLGFGVESLPLECGDRFGREIGLTGYR